MISDQRDAEEKAMDEQEMASLQSWRASLERSKMPRTDQNLPFKTAERQAAVLQQVQELLLKINQNCDAFSKMPAAEVQHKAVLYMEQMSNPKQDEHKCFIYCHLWSLKPRKLPSTYEELAAYPFKEVRGGFVDIERPWRETAFSDYDDSAKALIRLKCGIGLRAGELHVREMTDHWWDTWQHRKARKQDCMLWTAETQRLVLELFGLLRCVSLGRAAGDAYYMRSAQEEHIHRTAMPKTEKESEEESETFK